MKLAPCDDCAGYGIRLGTKCASCDGLGRVLPRPSRDALAALVGAEVLDTLAANRGLLVGWLEELEVLRPTGWREEFVPRDVTRGQWEKEYRPPERRVVPCEPGVPGRLYTVTDR